MLRRQRFQRSNNPPPIHLTDRDLEIIRQVHKHRFLRSTHIRKLTGGSSDAVLRRLQLLFQHGYLDRPRVQIDYYRRGSQPMAYGLGNKGAKELGLRMGIQAGKMDWTNKNRSVNRLYLEHTLAIAEVMIAVELACRGNTRVRLVEADNLVSTAERWNVTVRHRGKAEILAVVPDKIFALEFPEQPQRSVVIYLEADRATMPIVRAGLKQTSFFRKLLAYRESWRQKTHATLFGHQRCLVVTVTTSAARIGGLISAANKTNGGSGSGLFVFTTKDAVLTCHNLFALPFRSANGGTCTLGG
jgi:hypothetical protein